MTEHLIQDPLGELTPVHRRIAPPTLYVAGDIELVRASPELAVVGSRTPPAEGVGNAARVTRALVNLDTTVVSGLAAGIHTVAQRSAIEAGCRTYEPDRSTERMPTRDDTRGALEEMVQRVE